MWSSCSENYSFGHILIVTSYIICILNNSGSVRVWLAYVYRVFMYEFKIYNMDNEKTGQKGHMTNKACTHSRQNLTQDWHSPLSLWTGQHSLAMYLY